MQPKAPGQVPCAHCSRPGATASCPSCTHVVCEACRNDWTTCTKPCGREIRLGIGGRLPDVSHSGRFGLVSSWTGKLRVLDLRRVRYVSTAQEIPRFASYRRITSDGQLIAARELPANPNTGRPPRAELIVNRLPGGQTYSIAVAVGTSVLDSPGPQTDTMWVTRDERTVWYERYDETVQVTELKTRATHNVEPVPGGVVQCAWLDSTTGTLATGTYGAVHLHALGHGALEPRGIVRVPDDDLLAVILERGRLLTVSGRRHGDARVQVFEIDVTGEAPARSIYARDTYSPIATALSSDGRFVAFSRPDHRVELHAIDEGRMTELDGHTDPVRLVRFVRGDSELVTADDDNRVIIRPFIDGTYSPRTIEVDLPSEPMPFPDLVVEPD